MSKLIYSIAGDVGRARGTIFLRVLGYIFAGAAALCLLSALLLTCVEAVATQLTFYTGEYEKYANAETIGMSSDDLISVTEELINYLKGDRPNLDMQFTVKGETREVFNEREKAHMVDVIGLFEQGRFWRLILAVAGAAGLALSLLFSTLADVVLKHKLKDKLKIAGMGYLYGTALFALAAVAMAVLIARDFTGWFVRFHMVFFDNDLWLLDSNTDILIMMMPTGFFTDVVTRIGMFFGLGALATILVALAGVIPGGRARRLNAAALEQGPKGINKNAFADGQAVPAVEGGIAAQLPTWQPISAPGAQQAVWQPQDVQNVQWGAAQPAAQAWNGAQTAYGMAAPDSEPHTGIHIDAVAAGDGELYRIQAQQEPPTSAEAIFESFGLSEKDDAPLGPQAGQTPLPPTWGAQAAGAPPASQLPSWANPAAPPTAMHAQAASPAQSGDIPAQGTAAGETYGAFAAPGNGEQAGVYDGVGGQSAPVREDAFAPQGTQNPYAAPQVKSIPEAGGQQAPLGQNAWGTPQAQGFPSAGGAQNPFGAPRTQAFPQTGGQPNPFGAPQTQGFPQMNAQPGGFGAPPAQSFPQAQGFSPMGSQQSAYGAPAAQDFPQTGGVQNPFGAPQAQSMPQAGGQQMPFGMPQARDASQTGGQPNPFGAPQTQGFPQAPGAQSPFGMPQAQGFPQAPGVQSPFGMPQAQGFPQTGGQPNPFGAQQTQGFPQTGAPQAPFGAPQTQGFQQTPGAQNPFGMPQAQGYPPAGGAQNPFGTQQAQGYPAAQWAAQAGAPQAAQPWNAPQPSAAQQQQQQPGMQQWQTPPQQQPAQPWNAPGAQPQSGPAWGQPPQPAQAPAPPAAPPSGGQSVDDMLKRLNGMLNNVGG